MAQLDLRDAGIVSGFWNSSVGGSNFDSEARWRSKGVRLDFVDD